MNTMRRTIAEIEEELAEARRAEAEERNRLRQSVTPEYRYTFGPVKPGWGSSPIYDPDCRLVRLEGELLNADECKAVGQDPIHGGMTYLFNDATGRIVMSTGGGWLIIGDFRSQQVDDDTLDVFHQLSTFIVEHPEGGDVTDIIAAYRTRTGRS